MYIIKQDTLKERTHLGTMVMVSLLGLSKVVVSEEVRQRNMSKNGERDRVGIGECW